MAAVTPIAKTECPWIAIVYNPAKDIKGGANNFFGFSPDRAPSRPPVMRSLQLPPKASPSYVNGLGMEARAINLQPGLNMGISLADWLELEKADKEKGSRGEIQSLKIGLDKGIYQVVIPDNYDGITEPGLQHFSVNLALQLIPTIAHELWLDEWTKHERRAEILKAINEQRQVILDARARAAAQAS